MKRGQKISILGICSVLLVISCTFFTTVSAESIPPWIKNTALWYGEGTISESEFLNAIKFLLENGVIVLDEEEKDILVENITANVLIPNGNFDISNTAFYIPLNLEVEAGTKVVWVNDDSVPHTIQSQDQMGKIIGLFNSAPLKTGATFEYTFNKSGVYNYFCSLHPWRVGIITVR